MDFQKVIDHLNIADSYILQLRSSISDYSFICEQVDILKATDKSKHFKFRDILTGDIDRAIQARKDIIQNQMESDMLKILNGSYLIVKHMNGFFVEYVHDCMIELYQRYDFRYRPTDNLTKDLDQIVVLDQNGLKAVKEFEYYLNLAIVNEGRAVFMASTRDAFENKIDRYLRHMEHISINLRAMVAKVRLY